MLADLKQAVRLLAKNPGFTIVAVLTLALGIGANTAIFTITNALLLKALPYSDPDRIVVLSAPPSMERAESGYLSLPFFEVLKQRARSYSDLAVVTFEAFTLTGHGDPEQVFAARASWNFFDVLGVRPRIGRTFSRDEDQRGGPNVAMISHELWMRVFGGDPAAVGRSISLEGRDYTVLGVLPAGFLFAPIGKADVWVPRVGEWSLVTPARVAAGGRYFQVIGRLAPGVSPDQARAENQVLFEQYHRDFPGNFDATIPLVMQVTRLQERIVANTRPTIFILTAAVGFVLLIACANVASLLLSRSLGRRKEFAIRTALGGSRGALIRQLLIESVLVGVLSGMLGMAIGAVGTQLLAASQNVLQKGGHASIDGNVLFFVLAISVTAGILFGLAPSLQLSKPDLNSALREEGRGTAGNRKRNRGRGILVVAQVALSTVLLIGSGLLIRSFERLRSVAPGFEPKDLLTMQVSLRKYAQPSESEAFYQEVLRRVRALPGVTAAAISTALPPTATHATPVLFEGHPAVEIGKRPIIILQQISPGYDKALGVGVVAGRMVDDHDDSHAPKVALINEIAARRFWAGQNPIGKRVWVGTLTAPVEVVGVLADVRNSELAAPPAPEIFLAFAQLPWSFLCLSVRTAVEPHSLIGPVRREIAAVDRDQAVIEIHTGEELLESSAGQTRSMMLLLGVFAATAFVLAVIGLYGVIAYSVAQQTQEMGIRIALGASRGDILQLVIGKGLVLTGAGIAIGLAGSIAATRMLRAMLYETSTTDPATLVTCALLFTVVAMAASYLPARRATRIDPMDALRGE